MLEMLLFKASVVSGGHVMFWANSFLHLFGDEF